jgi:hypothetical protein
VRCGRSWRSRAARHHDKLRGEDLNREVFGSLTEALIILGEWREHRSRERNSIAKPDTSGTSSPFIWVIPLEAPVRQDMHDAVEFVPLAQQRAMPFLMTSPATSCFVLPR